MESKPRSFFEMAGTVDDIGGYDTSSVADRGLKLTGLDNEIQAEILL